MINRDVTEELKRNYYGPYYLDSCHLNIRNSSRVTLSWTDMDFYEQTDLDNLFDLVVVFLG